MAPSLTDDLRGLLKPWVEGRIGSVGPRLAQSLRCRPLDLFFQHFPLLGGEAHYSLALPFAGRFCGDHELVALCLLLPLAFFVTNACKVAALVYLYPAALLLCCSAALLLCCSAALLLHCSAQDVLCLPRPRGVPRLEGDYLEEFGFPSTHTAAAVVWARLLGNVAVQRGLNPGLHRQLAWAYIGLVAFARSYLGVHSLLDLAGGLVIGVSVVALVEAMLLAPALALIQTNLLGAVGVVVLLMCGPCLVFPDKRERTTFKDVLTMCSLSGGAVLAAGWRMRSSPRLAAPVAFSAVDFALALGAVGLADQVAGQLAKHLPGGRRWGWVGRRVGKYTVLGVVVGLLPALQLQR